MMMQTSDLRRATKIPFEILCFSTISSDPLPKFLLYTTGSQTEAYGASNQEAWAYVKRGLLISLSESRIFFVSLDFRMRTLKDSSLQTSRPDSLGAMMWRAEVFTSCSTHWCGQSSSLGNQYHDVHSCEEKSLVKKLERLCCKLNLCAILNQQVINVHYQSQVITVKEFFFFIIEDIPRA